MTNWAPCSYSGCVRICSPDSARLARGHLNSPAAVLPTEAEDELDDLTTKWRAP